MLGWFLKFIWLIGGLTDWSVWNLNNRPLYYFIDYHLFYFGRLIVYSFLRLRFCFLYLLFVWFEWSMRIQNNSRSKTNYEQRKSSTLSILCFMRSDKRLRSMNCRTQPFLNKYSFVPFSIRKYNQNATWMLRSSLFL